MKSFKVSLVLLATAISSGYVLYSILKKAGLEEIFDFDLSEDIDNELQSL